jgi:succinate dehydrogenase/fumarate reductase flavoprotein subunit
MSPEPLQAQFPTRQSSSPRSADYFDSIADVVVVGAGGGGLPTALFSAWLGNDVIVLEKASETGGTARKAAFWYWIPNNEAMKAAGIEDPKTDFLRYASRISRPAEYTASSDTFGMDDWTIEQFEAIYDSASEAAELLHNRGALPYRHVPDACDYWLEAPENRAPRGRVLIHRDASEGMADGGLRSVTTMTEIAEQSGVDIRTSQRAQRLIIDGGTVVGVESTGLNGELTRVGARKAVIFATGGFTHDAELRKHFLSLPLFAGCAAQANEGDFVRISAHAGAQLRNMNYAWMCPIPFESSIRRQPDLTGIFNMGGDSMILVSARGKREFNEKLQYNECAQEFFRWSPELGNYPNRIMIAVWDQQAQDNCAGPDYGNPVVPLDRDRANVMEADTLAELAELVRERLARYETETGGLTLTDDFLQNLESTVERFNGFARSGVDEDFARGTTAVQFQFTGPFAADPESPNVTMKPIAAQGPYYASLITGGTLDTKGGPKTNANGQVLDDLNRPIPGLYGVGNCVASASAGSYWAGGATLGPIIAMAFRAAAEANREAKRALGELANSSRAS